MTQRRQLLLIPEKQELILGAEAYQQMLAEAPLSQDSRLTEMVRRVGNRAPSRIAPIIMGVSYCWPNKRVLLARRQSGVYEGCRVWNEAGVATVMAHEFCTARHGGDR